MSNYGDITDASLGVGLLSVVARLNRWATRHADLALPPAQVRLLAQIEELGAVRIGDLARADHCSQPTMTTQVRRLLVSRLVNRVADPTDARAVLISLTARGRRRLDDVREARAAVLAPLVDRLAASDRRRLHAALHALTDLLNAAADTSHTDTSHTTGKQEAD